MQQEIQEAAVRWQNEVETGKRTIVGVNKFRAAEEPDVGIFRPDPATARDQVTALNHLRGERDGRAVETALAVLRSSARDDSPNLMPPIIEAVRVYATLGEICGVLREEFGEYTPPTVI